jgi:heptosyltransferase-1
MEQGLQLVLTWGDNVEKLAVERIAEACQGRAVIWPRGTLQELVALLAAARLVIGADTGPVHIAAAVGTPTVSIFRVTDSRRNGPPGEGHIRIQAPMDCSPCLRKSCDLDRKCGLSVTVDSVRDAVERLLGS